MRDLILTCNWCGHEEQGELSCERQIVERMREHIAILHPHRIGEFSDAVDEFVEEPDLYK